MATESFLVPTFLGIGVPKAGTTWLHNLLAEHPDVYVSKRVKEINYFNLRYDRGRAWYRSFFPDGEDVLKYRALGEISTAYLYCEACPERILALVPDVKLLLMLRNPVDRVWSHYRQRMRLEHYEGTFEDFLQEYPRAMELGLYTQPIQQYLGHFPAERLMVLISENAFADIPAAKEQLSQFLEVDPHQFPQEAGYTRVNKSIIPRFGRAYALAARARIWAAERDLYWLVNLANRLGLKKALRAGAKKQPMSMSPEIRTRLRAYYAQDVRDLERLLGIDLGHWQ